jgi:hypothetical protein
MSIPGSFRDSAEALYVGYVPGFSGAYDQGEIPMNSGETSRKLLKCFRRMESRLLRLSLREFKRFRLLEVVSIFWQKAET